MKFKNCCYIIAMLVGGTLQLSSCATKSCESVADKVVSIDDVLQQNALENEFIRFNADYRMLISIIELIKREHVVDYSRNGLIEKAIEGFLSTLDPHTSYLDKEKFKKLMDDTQGEFGGLGIEITMSNGLIRIISPMDDTPAFKAGLKSGDYILCINDKYIDGISSEDAIDKLRGKSGSKVKLKIKRNNKDPFDVEITRSIIKVQSVKAELVDEIAYIRISTFDNNTTEDLKKFIKQFKQGDKLKGVVLDLRDNPGGLLIQSFQVADAFLNEGLIVTTKGRDPAHVTSFSATPGDILGDLPLVVIINSGTASAPEIVAGALQDHNRAILVGTRTYGKGSVQQLIPLSAETGIKMTVAMHYRPSGECIQGKGITPDIEVKPSLVATLKDYVVLREENIPRAIGKLSEKEGIVTQSDAEKIKKEGETSKEKSVLDDLIAIVKSLFKKDSTADNKEIQKKLSEISNKNDKKEEDPELLYRTLSIKERKEKDAQMMVAFHLVHANYILRKTAQNKAVSTADKKK